MQYNTEYSNEQCSTTQNTIKNNTVNTPYLNKVKWHNVLLITKTSNVYSNRHLLSHTNPIQFLPIHFLQRYLNIIIISLPNLKIGLLTSGFPTKLYMNFSPLSCMLDAPPSSFSLIWSSQYLTRSTNYEFPHYVIFSIPLLFFSPQVQIFSTPCSQAPCV